MENQNNNNTGAMMGPIASMVGNVVNGAVSMTGMLDKGAREANVRIAEANAAAAVAQATREEASSKIFGLERNHVLIGGGILGIIILLLIFKKS